MQLLFFHFYGMDIVVEVLPGSSSVPFPTWIDFNFIAWSSSQISYIRIATSKYLITNKIIVYILFISS